MGLRKVTVISFGFARGEPPEADLQFDCRALRNPHRSPRLRKLTGLDDDVRLDVVTSTGYDELMDYILKAVTEPAWAEHPQPAEITVALGCTGGKHRSVVIAEELGKALGLEAEYEVVVVHRDLKKTGVAVNG